MRFKKGYLWIFAAMLLAALAIAPAAFAESSLGVTATTNPEEVEGPGEIEIRLSLANNGTVPLENITLVTEYGAEKILGTLEVGQTRTFRISDFIVNEYQVGGSVSFSFKWNEGGIQQGLSYPIAIKEKIPEPSIEATCAASSLLGKDGDEITITYTVKNTGDVSLTKLTITDPISPQAIAEDVDLGPGKTHEAKYTFTLKSSVASRPKVTALTEAGEEFSQDFPGLNVKMASPALTVIAAPGLPGADGIPVDITVKNTGNVSANEIILKDQDGKAIGEAFRLAEGAEKKIEHIVKIDAEKQFSVTASYIADGMGKQALTAASEPVGLKPVISAEDIKLSVEVIPNQTELSAPGVMNFQVLLKNEGKIPLLNLVISEQTRGSMQMISELPVGEQTVDLQLDMAQSGNLNIVVDYEDGQGGTYRAEAESPEISIVAPTPEPTPQPTAVITPEPETAKPFFNSFMTLVLIFVLAALLAACIIALIVVSILDGRNKRKAQELMLAESMMGNAPKPKRDLEPKKRPGPSNAMRHVPPPLPQSNPVEPIVPKAKPKSAQNKVQNKAIEQTRPASPKPEKLSTEQPPVVSKPVAKPASLTINDDDIRIREPKPKKDEAPARPVVKSSRELSIDDGLSLTELRKPAKKPAGRPISKNLNAEAILKKPEQKNRASDDNEIFENEFLDD